MTEYRKIKKISAADQVYEELKQMVVNETWKAGEKIPTETQLAEQFEVNRLTVRVALQRLQAIGLLDIRVGSGTYVRPFDMCSSIAELSDFYTNATAFSDAREYRGIIETECVRLAVARRTESELEQFWNKYLQMEEHVGHYCEARDPAAADREVILQTDMSLEIHTILCAMAHNELRNYAFAIAKGPIRQLMLRNVVQRIHDPETAYHTVRCYKELYYDLEARDLEKSLACIKRIMNIDTPLK